MRIATRIALPIGAVGAVGLMLYTGRHNPSVLLRVLFTLWVLGPFLALQWALMVSARWAVGTQATLRALTLILSVVTPAIYAYIAFGPPRQQTAATFVVVPPISCVLLAFALLAARRRA